MKNVPLTKVLVSPLRRAIESAYHMFKNHPNNDRLSYILLPTLSERVFASTDIPSHETLGDIIKEWEGKIDLKIYKGYSKDNPDWHF